MSIELDGREVLIDDEACKILFNDTVKGDKGYGEFRRITCKRIGRPPRRRKKYITIRSTGQDVVVGSSEYINLRRAGKIRGDEPQFYKEVVHTNTPKDIVEVRLNHVRKIKKLPKTGPSTMSTKSWDRVAPKTPNEKKLLRAQCGDVCFVRPKEEMGNTAGQEINRGDIPICPQTKFTGGVCAVDCRGLAAAKQTTEFLPDEYRAEIIPELQDHFTCDVHAHKEDKDITMGKKL